MERFRKLGLSEPILKAIEEHKFEKPSEIQEKCIPLVLQGKDIIAGSATGSGKTLAFGAGIIHNVISGKGVQALVLTPTRELAEQISVALKKFSKYLPDKINIASVYGGVSINPQMEEISHAEVVVATPGRILDHLERRTVNFENLKMLIIDEADRMFDMGFIDDLKRIIRECPDKRQTLLFSATISIEVSKLAEKYMNEPVEVSAESYVDASKLTQLYYDVDDKEKFSLLVHLLESEKSGLVMVFCNTRKNVDFVSKNLSLCGIDTEAIHGGFSQEKRNKTLGHFNRQKVFVLVCTDVAARGLDIKGVSHVYNYDIPKDSKEYIHRVGRTARAGKEGKAVNLVSGRDYENFGRVLRNDELHITKEETPEFRRVRIRWIPERRSFGQRQGFGHGGFRQRTNNWRR